jgi:hypothetical protein
MEISTFFYSLSNFFTDYGTFKVIVTFLTDLKPASDSVFLVSTPIDSFEDLIDICFLYKAECSQNNAKKAKRIKKLSL